MKRAGQINRLTKNKRRTAKRSGFCLIFSLVLTVFLGGSSLFSLAAGYSFADEGGVFLASTEVEVNDAEDSKEQENLDVDLDTDLSGADLSDSDDEDQTLGNSSSAQTDSSVQDNQSLLEEDFIDGEVTDGDVIDSEVVVDEVGDSENDELLVSDDYAARSLTTIATECGSFTFTSDDGGSVTAASANGVCKITAVTGTIYVSTSKQTSDRITTSGNLTLYFNGVNISQTATSTASTAPNYAPLYVESGTLNLVLVAGSSNSLTTLDSDSNRYTSGIALGNEASLELSTTAADTCNTNGYGRAGYCGYLKVSGINNVSGASAKNITISSGYVESDSIYYAAAIGTLYASGKGAKAQVESIQIGSSASTTSNTLVQAYSANYSAGIGTGYANSSASASVGEISVTGGKVQASASSTYSGAGIGTGRTSLASTSSVGSITLSGGLLIAGATYGSGIGTGYVSNSSTSTIGDLSISGATVTIALGTSSYGSGIGTGYTESASTSTVEAISITSGTVSTSSNISSGIGTGYTVDTDTISSIGYISITGGEVSVRSTNYGAGIGTGYTRQARVSIGYIRIYEPTSGSITSISATSGLYAAAIGSGYTYGSVGTSATVYLGYDANGQSTTSSNNDRAISLELNCEKLELVANYTGASGDLAYVGEGYTLDSSVILGLVYQQECNNTQNCSAFVIEGGEADYYYEDGVCVITKAKTLPDSPVVIKMRTGVTTATDRLKISVGQAEEATLYFDNLTIATSASAATSDPSYAPVYIESGTLNLVLAQGSLNSFSTPYSSNYYLPGLALGEQANVKISTEDAQNCTTLTTNEEDSCGFLQTTGIGNAYNTQAGNITIESGNIESRSYYAAGIGTTYAYGKGVSAKVDKIVIGTDLSSEMNLRVSASSDYGSGIGTGNTVNLATASVGDIVISNGTVEASSTNYGSGIGTGNTSEQAKSSVENITISNGAVKAKAESTGAGIGTGSTYSSSQATVGTISLSGAQVSASSYYEAGIGTGDTYANTESAQTITEIGTISISAGEVEAISTYYGSGIGTGYVFTNKTNALASSTIASVEISAGNVTALAQGAGIGTGHTYNGEVSSVASASLGSVSITGGAVSATSTGYGAAIGTGETFNNANTVASVGYVRIAEESANSIEEIYLTSSVYGAVIGTGYTHANAKAYVGYDTNGEDLTQSNENYAILLNISCEKLNFVANYREGGEEIILGQGATSGASTLAKVGEIREASCTDYCSSFSFSGDEVAYYSSSNDSVCVITKADGEARISLGLGLERTSTRLTVAPTSGTATLYFDSVVIDNTEATASTTTATNPSLSPLFVQSGQLNLVLVAGTTSKLITSTEETNSYIPGLGLADGASLVISQSQAGTSGTLETTGITSAYQAQAKSISIISGTVTSTAILDNAAIGVGIAGSLEELSLLGGIVTATSTTAAGIGVSQNGVIDNLSIESGIISSSSESDAAIAGTGGTVQTVSVSGSAYLRLSGAKGAIFSNSTTQGFNLSFSGTPRVYATVTVPDVWPLFGSLGKGQVTVDSGFFSLESASASGVAFASTNALTLNGGFFDLSGFGQNKLYDRNNTTVEAFGVSSSCSLSTSNFTCTNLAEIVSSVDAAANSQGLGAVANTSSETLLDWQASEKALNQIYPTLVFADTYAANFSLGQGNSLSWQYGIPELDPDDIGFLNDTTKVEAVNSLSYTIYDQTNSIYSQTDQASVSSFITSLAELATGTYTLEVSAVLPASSYLYRDLDAYKGYLSDDPINSHYYYINENTTTVELTVSPAPVELQVNFELDSNFDPNSEYLIKNGTLSEQVTLVSATVRQQGEILMGVELAPGTSAYAGVTVGLSYDSSTDTFTATLISGNFSLSNPNYQVESVTFNLDYTYNISITNVAYLLIKSYDNRNIWDKNQENGYSCLLESVTLGRVVYQSTQELENLGAKLDCNGTYQTTGNLPGSYTDSDFIEKAQVNLELKGETYLVEADATTVRAQINLAGDYQVEVTFADKVYDANLEVDTTSYTFSLYLASDVSTSIYEGDDSSTSIALDLSNLSCIYAAILPGSYSSTAEENNLNCNGTPSLAAAAFTSSPDKVGWNYEAQILPLSRSNQLTATITLADTFYPLVDEVTLAGAAYSYQVDGLDYPSSAFKVQATGCTYAAAGPQDNLPVTCSSLTLYYGESQEPVDASITWNISGSIKAVNTIEINITNANKQVDGTSDATSVLTSHAYTLSSIYLNGNATNDVKDWFTFSDLEFTNCLYAFSTIGNNYPITCAIYPTLFYNTPENDSNLSSDLAEDPGTNSDSSVIYEQISWNISGSIIKASQTAELYVEGIDKVVDGNNLVTLDAFAKGTLVSFSLDGVSQGSLEDYTLDFAGVSATYSSSEVGGPYAITITSGTPTLAHQGTVLSYLSLNLHLSGNITTTLDPNDSQQQSHYVVQIHGVNKVYDGTDTVTSWQGASISAITKDASYENPNNYRVDFTGVEGNYSGSEVLEEYRIDYQGTPKLYYQDTLVTDEITYSIYGSILEEATETTVINLSVDKVFDATNKVTNWQAAKIESIYYNNQLQDSSSYTLDYTSAKGNYSQSYIGGPFLVSLSTNPTVYLGEEELEHEVIWRITGSILPLESIYTSIVLYVEQINKIYDGSNQTTDFADAVITQVLLDGKVVNNSWFRVDFTGVNGTYTTAEVGGPYIITLDAIARVYYALDISNGEEIEVAFTRIVVACQGSILESAAGVSLVSLGTPSGTDLGDLSETLVGETTLQPSSSSPDSSTGFVPSTDSSSSFLSSKIASNSSPASASILEGKLAADNLGQNSAELLPKEASAPEDAADNPSALSSATSATTASSRDISPSSITSSSSWSFLYWAAPLTLVAVAGSTTGAGLLLRVRGKL